MRAQQRQDSHLTGVLSLIHTKAGAASGGGWGGGGARQDSDEKEEVMICHLM